NLHSVQPILPREKHGRSFCSVRAQSCDGAGRRVGGGNDGPRRDSEEGCGDRCWSGWDGGGPSDGAEGTYCLPLRAGERARWSTTIGAPTPQQGSNQIDDSVVRKPVEE